MAEGEQKRKKGTRFFKMMSLGIKRFRDPYYHGFAAQMAFFYILSIVPLALLLSQLLMYIFQTDINSVVGWFLSNTESGLAKQLENLLAYKSAGAINVLYIFIALWAASRAQFALTRITNFTYTDGQTTGKSFWAERIRAVGTMFITLFVLFAALAVLIYGNKIVTAFFGDLNAWTYLRWPVAFILYLLVIIVMYYILPTTKWKFRQLIPGTLFSAVGLLIVTWLYGLWVDLVVDYDIVYGALSNIVALMFWFYFFAWVICLGALFNKLLVDTKDIDNIESFDYGQYIRNLEDDG